MAARAFHAMLEPDHHGEYRRNCLWKSFESIDDGDQDIFDSAVFELVHDRQPELGSFALLNPDPKHFLGAIALGCLKPGKRPCF